MNNALQIILLLLSAGIADVVVFISTGNSTAGILTFLGVVVFGSYLKAISGGN